MLSIVKYLSIALIIALGSTILHELAHLFLCLLFKCRVVEFKIPFFVLYSEGHMKMQFSLKSSHCSFATKNKSKAFWIVLIGPLIDVLVVIALLLFLFFVRFDWGVLVAIVFNLILCVYNLLPAVGGDGVLICELFKER